MFNITTAQMNALSAMQHSFGGAKVSSFDTPTACTTCWGGSCATNPITG